jgi:pyrimidine operon attenuation protein/uracil phosphoribosyltransferase
MTTQLLDAGQLAAKIEEMAESLTGLADGPEGAAILGIRTRGAVLAERLHKLLAERHGWHLPLGILDITLYRDDLSQLAVNPLVRKTHLNFDIDGKTILLIDDVLYTGRTIRSAIDEIIDFGRPKAIRLAVLVDRGGREFPIQPDACPYTIPVAEDEVVKVCLTESDGSEQILLAKRSEIKPKQPVAG